MLLLPLLLLGCAGNRAAHDLPAKPEVARQERPATPAAPDLAQRESAPRHWSPALRASVMRQCQVAIPDDLLCTCLTRQLELLSPDPETEFTDEDIQTGLNSCRSTGAGDAL